MENFFHVTDPLRGEFTGHRWTPLTKASDAGLWWVFFIWAWINRWVNNCEAGELRRHRAHYDVIVMCEKMWIGCRWRIHTTVHKISFQQFWQARKDIYVTIVVSIENFACFKYRSYFNFMPWGNLATCIVWIIICIVGNDNSSAWVLTKDAGMLS